MTIFSDLLRVLRLGTLALLIAAMPAVLRAETVTIDSAIQVGYEQGSVPATIVVSRDGNSALTVRLKPPLGTATLTADYTVTRPGGATDLIPIGGGSGGYDLQFAQGENNKILLITPVDDALVEMREIVTLQIANDPGTFVPVNVPSYIVGAPNSAQISIGDNDLSLTTDTPDPVADEDVTLNSPANDGPLLRRGIISANFSQVFSRSRNVAILLDGTATYQTDYVVTYRISGNDYLAHASIPVAQPWDPVGGTANSSHIGYTAGAPSTGTGYKIVAHRIGETAIFVQGTGTLASGSQIRFQNHLTVYTTTSNFTGSSTGPVLLGISPALTSNITNGLSIAVLTGSTPTNQPSLAVSRIYPKGTTVVEVAGGFGGLYRGDSFTLKGENGVRYVALNDVLGSQGTLEFYCYEFLPSTGYNGGGGLAQDVSTTTDLITFIIPDVNQGGFFNFVFPAESQRVEFSIEPVFGDGVLEGRETVKLTLVASEDYQITNPTVSQVVIADRDSTANIVMSANAGKPGSIGSFTVTLTNPLPVAVTIPYQLSGSAIPGPSNTGTVNDYVALLTGATAHPYSGSLTIPAGQTTGSIVIVPALRAAGTTTVVATLSSSLDYKLAGSSGSGTNPSATMSISDSLGSVSIAAITSSAVESSTPSVATKGLFRVSIVRTPSTSGAVQVSLRFSGTAAYLSRYSIEVAGAPQALTSSGGAFITQVSIPNGSNFVDVSVVPINNFTADNSQSVIAQVQAGQGYTIGSPSLASVTILDDEPTISIAVGSLASKPSTPGYFTVSYPGASLGSPVLVSFTLSGSAVLGTDYSANTGTVTISATSNSATIPIAPMATPDDLDKTVTATLTSNPGYSINSTFNSADMTLLHATTSSGTKPTPGTINTGGSGGCGLGSGIATLAGLGLLAFRLSLIRRRRRG